MKKKLALIVGLLAALTGTAQVPQEIKNITVEEHDSAWYARQAEGWQLVTEAEPQNERAWRNLYEALRYLHRSEQAEDVSAMKNALSRMATAIPDSYTYNRCMYLAANGSPEGDAFALRMGELLPEHPGQDYETLLCFYWRKGRWNEVNDCASRYFAEDVVPTKLLRYNYNQLQGLPEGAIFFGQGDAELIPKLMLQAGSGVHRDKVIVPLQFLFIEEYVEALCRNLGLDTTPKNWNEYYAGTTEEARRHPDSLFQNYLQTTALQLMRLTGRAAYFTPSMAFNEMRELADNLYNEGLSLRYSETPYDNMNRLRRNVEENYTLDYLLEPPFCLEARWLAAERMQANCVTMLAPLVAWYHEQAKKQSSADPELLSRSHRLSHFLLRALERMDIPTDQRLQLEEYVKQQTSQQKK